MVKKDLIKRHIARNEPSIKIPRHGRAEQQPTYMAPNTSSHARPAYPNNVNIESQQLGKIIGANLEIRTK